MCVEKISEELIANKDFIAYKIVLKIGDNIGESEYKPYYRIPQNKACGTLKLYKIGSPTKSSFKKTPGLYLYKNSTPILNFSTMICLIKSGTKYKKAKSNGGNIDVILSEEVTPLCWYNDEEAKAKLPTRLRKQIARSKDG